MKTRWDGHLADELFKYVDDIRVTAFSLELCWAVVQRFLRICAHLGIQNRAAKRTWPSTAPGPWAGTVCHTDGGEVAGCVSQEKWEKMQGLIRELANMVKRADRAAEAHRKGPRMVVWDPDPRPGAATGAYRWEDGGSPVYRGFYKVTEMRVNRKRLEAIRGFLNYAVRTYPWMNTYIKGLHLTIGGWRRGRVAGGWRDNWQARSKPRMHIPARRAWDTQDEEARQEDGTEEQEAPATVAVQPRLRSDIRCLLQLTAPRAPPKERYRAGSTSVAYYMPGDASRKGFGSALIGPDRACDGGEEGCSRISGGGNGRTTHCARTRAVSHG